MIKLNRTSQMGSWWGRRSCELGQESVGRQRPRRSLQIGCSILNQTISCRLAVITIIPKTIKSIEKKTNLKQTFFFVWSILPSCSNRQKIPAGQLPLMWLKHSFDPPNTFCPLMKRSDIALRLGIWKIFAMSFFFSWGHYKFYQNSSNFTQLLTWDLCLGEVKAGATSFVSCLGKGTAATATWLLGPGTAAGFAMTGEAASGFLPFATTTTAAAGLGWAWWKVEAITELSSVSALGGWIRVDELPFPAPLLAGELSP